MDYSIVIPVFNKAALTRHCLETIRPTLAGAGQGEIIVIDNASTDETPQMLAEFPWIRVVRNKTNRGFSGANNQGAQLANGMFLVLLNNDIEAHPGWLASMLSVAREPGVGAVGARLLFPDGSLQHAGVVLEGIAAGGPGFVAFHDMYRHPGNYPPAGAVLDLSVVTGACLVTPRSLYGDLGGLDEGFWNGYEDVDYCLKVRERGLRVVYDGRAVLTHFESQSGPQRFRKIAYNVERLAARWNGRVRYDAQPASLSRGTIRRHVRMSHGAQVVNVLPVPQTTIVCHGDVEDARAMERMLRANSAPVERIIFTPETGATAAARVATEVRADRYVAFVDARCKLGAGWLDELVSQIEFSPTTGAAAFVPEFAESGDAGTLAADARCTLVAMRKFPQHLRLEALDTLGGSVADFLIRGIGAGAGTRGCSKALGDLPPCEPDAAFEQHHGMPLKDVFSPDPELVERAIRRSKGRRPGLVSIVMLSWNAPEFTKMALESIRKHTVVPYEVIVVDNGSRAETVEWLRTVQDVRIIYNSTNRGYAAGNNQAIAASSGEYIVLLNNDVIVTDGWLDGLLSAFERVPGLGVSAPRSNRVAGDQQTVDSQYANLDEMAEYARDRRLRYAGEGYATDRAIGLCLCIDRRVIEEIGGIDERFGAGNFEDDDFCIRVRAAGYRIFVCDDVFIHHFGSQTFAANKVDWQQSMHENWKKFAQKWKYPQAYPKNGYAPGPAIAQGFERERHYVALPAAGLRPSGSCEAAAQPAVAFAAPVRDERDWNGVGAFVRRYLCAFGAEHATLLTIAATGTVSAATLGQRVEKILDRLGLSQDRAADIEIADEPDEAAWLASLNAGRVLRLEDLDGQSPSALRRTVAALK